MPISPALAITGSYQRSFLLCSASHERASALRRETAHCRSLISHSRPAVSVSCASGLGGFCCWSKKYTPLTFATGREGAQASKGDLLQFVSGPIGHVDCRHYREAPTPPEETLNGPHMWLEGVFVPRRTVSPILNLCGIDLLLFHAKKKAPRLGGALRETTRADGSTTGALTCNFGQWIVDGLRLTECDDSAISRHGVSLLSGGSGRLDTRLDTPPSTKRRHPDSGLAPLRP
jgi:hypothetical protein